MKDNVENNRISSVDTSINQAVYLPCMLTDDGNNYYISISQSKQDILLD